MVEWTLWACSVNPASNPSTPILWGACGLEVQDAGVWAVRGRTRSCTDRWCMSMNLRAWCDVVTAMAEQKSGILGETPADSVGFNVFYFGCHCCLGYSWSHKSRSQIRKTTCSVNLSNPAKAPRSVPTAMW